MTVIIRLTVVLAAACMIVLVACDPFGREDGTDPADACGDACIVSGYVYDEEDNPLKDVKVARSGSGVGYVLTDKNGHYAFSTNVLYWNYCFTPSKPRWSFEPNQRCYTHIYKNHTNQNFVAALVESFDISGYVIDQQSVPVRDAVIVVAGGEGASVRTNAQGYYIVMDLTCRQDYCLTPVKSGYSFEPAEQCYEDLRGDQYDQNFVAILDESAVDKQ